MKRSHLITGLAALLVAAACADDGPTIPGPTTLTGLVRVESNDTIATQPPPTAPATPGAFHGFVLGHGIGPDTLATAPRLQDVVVTAYPHLGWNGPNPIVGDVAATRTTDASGAFQFPTLPGGEYVITFVPPPSSTYGATFVTTTIHSGSDDGNWWVILPLK